MSIDHETLHDYVATRDLNRAARRRLMQRTITCRGCHVRIKARHAAEHMAKCQPALKAAAAELLHDVQFRAAIEQLPDPTDG